MDLFVEKDCRALESFLHSKVPAFSIETAGIFDCDCEMELWLSGLGHVKFEFAGSCNIRPLAKEIVDFECAEACHWHNDTIVESDVFHCFLQ
ncbi:MAG: PH domain-containing protein [Christensenellaceae bacterium]|nr:PH domain-containing protein [Christensenellaceae bacterium]